MKKKVGYVIKELRKQRGLSQIYVAYRLNITVESFANIENGRVDINTERLEKIASILNTSASQILFSAESLNSTNGLV